MGPVLFVLFVIIPIGELEQQLSFEGRIVLAATLWMGTWWITEAIPIYGISYTFGSFKWQRLQH